MFGLFADSQPKRRPRSRRRQVILIPQLMAVEALEPRVALTGLPVAPAAAESLSTATASIETAESGAGRHSYPVDEGETAYSETEASFLPPADVEASVTLLTFREMVDEPASFRSDQPELLLPGEGLASISAGLSTTSVSSIRAAASTSSLSTNDLSRTAFSTAQGDANGLSRNVQFAPLILSELLSDAEGIDEELEAYRPGQIANQPESSDSSFDSVDTEQPEPDGDNVASLRTQPDEAKTPTVSERTSGEMEVGPSFDATTDATFTEAADQGHTEMDDRNLSAVDRVFIDEPQFDQTEERLAAGIAAGLTAIQTRRRRRRQLPR